MTVKTDPAVTVATLATALFRSEKTLTVAYMAGEMPAPDSMVRDARNYPRIRAWRMSTLRAWNPVVADRCQAILDALERIPLNPAA